MDKWISLGLLAALALTVYGQKKRRGTRRECFSCCRGRRSEEIGHVL